MNSFENKKIYFSGRGEKIDKEELEKFLIQNGASFVESTDDADVIIQGYMTPVHLEDEFYLLSKDGKELYTIEEIEKWFSNELDLDSILMAIKISKENQRVINLLKNNYFNDDVFVKILKYYNWEDIGIYDSDDNRDVATAITGRFCSLVELNHNIQHSPIGIYYTALETTNSKLLEAIYNMPHYEISDKNAHEDQPITLKEVVALNPNTPLPVLIQILKNNNHNELVFLAQNNSINKLIKKQLFELNDNEIKRNLVIANNIDEEFLDSILKDTRLKQEYIKNTLLDDTTFNKILSLELNETDIVYLSSNSSLTTKQITTLFEKNIPNANINLLRNTACSIDSIEEFLKMDDKVYNIAIASNESLTNEVFEKLLNFNDFDVNIAIAFNNKAPQSILKNLYEQDNEQINTALSQNNSTPINILMQLQVDSRYHTYVSNNETYKEFSRTTLGIIQNQNSQFKRNIDYI